MNSFRRPVLSSAIPSHCVPAALQASGSATHTSATLRAETKRRVESVIFSGADPNPFWTSAAIIHRALVNLDPFTSSRVVIFGVVFLPDSTRRFFSARSVADVCVALPLAGKAVDTQW